MVSVYTAHTWSQHALFQVCNKLVSDVHKDGQKDYFQVTDELSRENSHFSLSEALLTVVEQVYNNTRDPVAQCLTSNQKVLQLGSNPSRVLIFRTLLMTQPMKFQVLSPHTIFISHPVQG